MREFGVVNPRLKLKPAVAGQDRSDDPAMAGSLRYLGWLASRPPTRLRPSGYGEAGAARASARQVVDASTFVVERRLVYLAVAHVLMGSRERRLVPKGGFEPPLPEENCALNAARLPVPPLRHAGKRLQGAHHRNAPARCQQTGSRRVLTPFQNGGSRRGVKRPGLVLERG